MNITNNQLHNPCEKCHIRGHSFSPKDKHCQKCEYYVAIEVLKHVLKTNDFCLCCLNKKSIGGGYFDCKVNEDYGGLNCPKFIIDWEKVFKEYNFEIKE